MMKPAVSEPVNPEGSFFWVGNHRALDFSNTLAAGKQGPIDLLRDWNALRHWLRVGGNGDAARLADAPLPDALAASALAAVRGYRDLLKGSLDGYSKTGDAKMLIQATNDLLRSLPGHWQITGNHAARLKTWRPAEVGTLAETMGWLALTVADFLTAVPHAEVRKCANPACVLWFHDNSRNHTRQWCSMAACGNREKAAAHRAKLRRRSVVTRSAKKMPKV